MKETWNSLFTKDKFHLINNWWKDNDYICGAAADICLLGPQVRFNMDAVKKQVSCPVEAIDMKAYGMMDGKAVIEAVRKTLGD